MSFPVVAVVGRPNVGKSSLVNRILGRREAIVQETPGVTRDRRSFVAEWRGRRFEVIDTGGLEPGQKGLEERVAAQARIAIEAADVIVLVVDTATGPNQDDLVVAEILRRAGTPVVVAANKADEPRDEAAATEFFRLGLGEPMPLSALHGRGSGDLLDAIVACLPDALVEPTDAWASIAIVGRPNVGKSSTLNRLLGEARSIVHEAPGTTRDPIDSYLELPDGRRIRIIDTAGMRRRTRIDDSIEYFSYLRARGTIERSDAVVLLIDAADGVTGPDQRLVQGIVEAGRACVVALNKWDLVTDDPTERSRLDARIEDRLRFIPWATVLRTSAVTGRGMDRILPAVMTAVDSHRTRIPTPLVNSIVGDAQERRPHPRRGGKAVRILYAVQAGIAPPRIILFSSGRVDDAYLRYLENRIRAAEPFLGSPVVLHVRRRARP